MSSLPAGWEAQRAPDGRTYYIDHNTRSTHWELPPSVGQANPGVPAKPQPGAAGTPGAPPGMAAAPMAQAPPAQQPMAQPMAPPQPVAQPAQPPQPQPGMQMVHPSRPPRHVAPFRP